MGHDYSIPAVKEKSLKKLKDWALKNPERARQTQINWQKNNKEKHKAAIKRWRIKNSEQIKIRERARTKREFFKNRARASIFRSGEGDKLTIANAIFWIWFKQKGKCALTGKRLDRTAQLDHIIPLSKGGKNTPSNLQWLACDVNQCKDDMTTEQFIELCKQVISHTQTK